MTAPYKLPVGTQVDLPKHNLQQLLDALAAGGYRVIGPQVADGAVILDDLRSVEQLPLGWLDEQDGGRYRLYQDEQAGYFDHVVGPHSLKQFLFPPTETLQQLSRTSSGWHVTAPPPEAPRIAVLGVRSCDLHAIAIQDRVFLEGPYVDAGYQARRQNLFLVSVQCRRAAATCFCHSMKTGPRAKTGFDLALSELSDEFCIEVGSEVGGALLAEVAGWQLASTEMVGQAEQQSRRLREELESRGQTSTSHRSESQDSNTQASNHDPAPRPRELNTHDIRELLLDNLEHSHWERIAERCLSCANCTLVCPTCFCSTVEEVGDLTGEQVQRQRQWSSCFNSEHSYTSSGVVHHSTASRYRQWLTHKLATWQDQFDTSGCVGCGRCITWCPVGIDLTEEVATLRNLTS